MKLLAIVVNYKTLEMTLRAARAAVMQLIRLSNEWRLVIVDNDSRDGSSKILEDARNNAMAEAEVGWDKVEIMASDHNSGFGAGNNLAIEKYLKAQRPPEYFYLMNSDAFPEDNSIDKLLTNLESSPEVGIAGSYIHGPEGEPHTTAFRFPPILGELEGSIRLGIVQVGSFDEEFFLYFEETDLCKRAAEAGWRTRYVRNSSVSHIGSASTGMKKWSRIPGYWLDSGKHYFVKNHGTAYYVLATLSRLFGHLLWAIRRKLEGKPRVEPKNNSIFTQQQWRNRVLSNRVKWEAVAKNAESGHVTNPVLWRRLLSSLGIGAYDSCVSGPVINLVPIASA